MTEKLLTDVKPKLLSDLGACFHRAAKLTDRTS